MTSDDQRSAADRIASEYSESVRITPNAGPLEDLTVVSCPDGRQVVLKADGGVLADSAPNTTASSPLARSVTGPEAGYDPATDALLIEALDDEWVLVPPWRCAMSAREHLPLAAVEARLRDLRAWHANVIGEGSLRVWELRRGKAGLKRNA